MRYWGWRPLVFSLWISVLITACSETPHLPIITPTSQSAVTLTYRFATAPPSKTPTATPVMRTITPSVTETPAQYRVGSDDTWFSMARHFDISPQLLQAFNGNMPLNVGQHIRIPAPLATNYPQSVHITPPTCYETPTDALLCIGEVNNTQAYPIGRVMLRLALTRPDGGELAAQVVPIATRQLAPGQSAPYHTIFTRQALSPLTASTAYYGMVVTLFSADQVTAKPIVQADNELTIADEKLTERNNYVVITGTLTYWGTKVVEDVRVIVTLRNAKGHILAYRVIEIAQIQAGEMLPLHVLLLPITDTTLARPLTYSWLIDTRFAP